MSGEILETPRLLLKTLERADVEQLQAVFPHLDIVRLMAVPWPFPPDAVGRFFEHIILPAAERGDEWQWTLRLKSDPEKIVGAISLMKSDINNRGYWLIPAWHGKGLMLEACDAVNDYWFDVLGNSVLREEKAAENYASRRISQKQGMRMIETAERHYVSGRLPAEIWEITVEEWRAQRSNGKRIA